MLLLLTLMVPALTLAAPPIDDFKICFIGDSGTGQTAQYAVASALQKENCQQIRHVGDIVYPSGIRSLKDPDLKEKFLKPYDDLLKNKTTPFFFLSLGNHDYRGSLQAWKDLTKSNKAIYFGDDDKSYYQDTFGDICFLTLDTAELKKAGLGQKQRQWIVDTKSKLKQSCKFSIAYGHHPYISLGAHGDARRKLKGYLEENVVGSVDLYVAGHDHNLADEGVISGTRLLISGGGGARLRGVIELKNQDERQAFKEYGYITLTFKKDKDGSIIGNYQIKRVSKQGDKNLRSGTIKGNGIRETKVVLTVKETGPITEDNVIQRYRSFIQMVRNSDDKSKYLSRRDGHMLKKLFRSKNYKELAQTLNKLIPSTKPDLSTTGKKYIAKYPARKTSEVLPNSFESSHFGIFALYSPKEFGYFARKKGFTEDDLWQWTQSHAKKLGVHWTRTNMQLIWDIIEPKLGGKKVWNDLIPKRIYSSNSNIHWLGVLHLGSWGRRQRPGRNKRRKLRNPLDHISEYLAFVQAAVERLDGDGKGDISKDVKVKYWQVGNEIFEPPHGVDKNLVNEYVRLVKGVRKATKAADPDSKLVLIAPTTGLKTSSFLIDVIKKLAATKMFDVIDIHHWGSAGKWAMPAIAEYRALLDSLGLNEVQIWSTENGTWYGTPDRQKIKQSEQDQARSLIKRYVFNLNSGLDKLFWNNLIEWHNFGGRSGSAYNFMGLVTDGIGRDQDPKRFDTEVVAYWSYLKLASLIDNYYAKSLGMITTKEVDVYAFDYKRLKDNKHFYIVWSEKENKLVELKAQGAGKAAIVTNLISDRFGNSAKSFKAKIVNGKINLNLNKDPLLVEFFDINAKGP
ncbi:MAG: metallophosphoesterase [Bacteriovoracaceae bacterium]|nr:metallophosphoesterase [Bacteriovoracaceae bacterium]